MRSVSQMSPGKFAQLVAQATRLGTSDAMDELPDKTGRQVVAALGVTDVTHGHVRYLRYAYMAGRFHLSLMGSDLAL